MRKPKKITLLSGHNERKLSILITVFDHFKTAGEVAKETLPEGEDFKVHKRNIQYAMSRYRWHFTHPYLIHETLNKAREGGKVAYKCTVKGRKMACELFYRKRHGIMLKWWIHGRGDPYHVHCSYNGCGDCPYNPTRHHYNPKMYPVVKDPLREEFKRIDEICKKNQVEKEASKKGSVLVREPKNINEYKCKRIVEQKVWWGSEDKFVVGDFMETETGKLVVVSKEKKPLKDIAQICYWLEHRTLEDYMKYEFPKLTPDSLIFYYTFK